jgi:hypothetical protein
LDAATRAGTTVVAPLRTQHSGRAPSGSPSRGDYIAIGSPPPYQPARGGSEGRAGRVCGRSGQGHCPPKKSIGALGRARGMGYYGISCHGRSNGMSSNVSQHSQRSRGNRQSNSEYSKGGCIYRVGIDHLHRFIMVTYFGHFVYGSFGVIYSDIMKHVKGNSLEEIP